MAEPAIFSLPRDVRRLMAKENAKWPAALREVPRIEWPNRDGPQLRVLRSRDYLVQEFTAPAPAIVRLSINRTSIAGDRWTDGIAWEDLQRLKCEAGYPDHDAVEVYPAQDDVVNVANMRHLWVLSDKLPFAWRGRA